MAEDQGKEEEKFDFTSEGEGYISLAEARVLAMQTASSVPGDYGPQYRGVAMVFEVAESGEDDDYYTVTLSVRPQGDFLGRPGQEQFVVGKEGTIALRQVLSLPTQTSASPAGTARKGGGFPILPVAIGVVIVGVIAAVGAVVILMSSGGDSVPIAAVLPTETPTPTETTPPTPTYTPIPIPTARVIVVTPTFTPRPTPTKTPRPTPTPNGSSYYNKGMEHREAANWMMAIEEFDKAIDLDPNYTAAYDQRGWAYYNLGQHQTAINDYNKAIDLDPNYAEAYNHRGIYYHSVLEQTQPAIDEFDKAIQLDSDFAKPYNNRGNVYRGLGQYQRSIEDYAKAIQIEPNAVRHANRAISYYYLGQHQNTIADWTSAIQFDFPHLGLAFHHRGISYRALGQPTLADADETMACSLDSQYC